MDRRNYALILILLLAASPAIYSAYYAWAVPAPSIGATVESGSLATGCDFIIYPDGASTIAKNCRTGANDFSGTVATTVIENALGTTGGHIHFKGSVSITAGITWDLTVDGDNPLKFTGDVAVINGSGQATSLPEFVRNGHSSDSSTI